MATVTVTTDDSQASAEVTFTFTDTTVTAARVERIDEGSVATTLRASAALTFTGGAAVVVVDHEIPLDAWVYYRVTQLTPTGSETGTSAWVAVASGGASWLKDPAFPSRSLRLDEVSSITELTRTARSGVFNILDRVEPVVIAARRSAPTGELVCFTATDDQRRSMLDLLSRGQILLLSTPHDYGLGNVYVHVGDVVETRVGLAMNATRQWTLPLTFVQRPLALGNAAMGMRWADVVYGYTSWSDLLATGMTWGQLLESAP